MVVKVMGSKSIRVLIFGCIQVLEKPSTFIEVTMSKARMRDKKRHVHSYFVAYGVKRQLRHSKK